MSDGEFLRSWRCCAPRWVSRFYRPPLLACAALVAVLAVSAADGPAADAAGQQQLRVHVGARHAPVRAVIRANLDSKVRVRVNGHRAGKAFERRGYWRRVGFLGANDGVRHGRNRLRVAIINGKRRRHLTQRFSIRRGRAIAGAGPDRVTRVGARVRLNGRASRLGAGTPARNLRWRLVRAPRGSDARLIRPRGRRPVLRPDRHGTYEARLTIGGHRRGHRIDTVTVTALPADPPIGAPLNTLAQSNGQIVIDGRPVPGTGGGTTAPVSVAILDRGSRQLLSSFTTDRGPTGIAKLAGAVAQQRSLSSIVIVNGISGLDPAAVGPFSAVLQSLGGAGLDAATRERLASGQPFSVVGVVNGGAGAAFTNFGGPTSTDPAAPTLSGALAGHLQLNPATDQYGFVFGDYAGFDTQIGDLSDENTMKIGTASPGGELSDGDLAGFQVVVADARSLQVKRNQVFAVNSLTRIESDVEAAMAAFLRGVGADELVFVQSIGDPEPSSSNWDDIARVLARLGGTRSVFNGLDGSGGYALVGARGLEGPAPEASYPLTQQSPAALAGTLQRTRDAGFDPTLAAAASDVNDGLVHIAYQPPTAFPSLGGPGGKAAAKYIADKLNLSSSDMREDYYVNYEADWDAIAARIPTLAYSKTGDFTKAEFASVQKQLGDEANAVAAVKHYIANLQSPFTAGLTSFVDLQQISKSIISEVTPPDVHTDADTLSIMSSALGIASLVPGVGEVFGILSGAFGIAATLSGRDGASLLPEIVDTRTSELATALVNRYTQATESLTVIGLLLVSDYGKLTTVARLSTRDAAWRWPPGGGRIPGVLRTSAKRWFYSELMPTAWALYDLYDVPNARQWYCSANTGGSHFANFFTFSKEPDSGQYRPILGFDGQGLPVRPYVQALGAPSGAFVGETNAANPPSPGLMDPLFTPVAEGGLGMFQPWFFRGFAEYPQEVDFGQRCVGG